MSTTTSDEQRVLDACDQLVAELPPDRTDPIEFLGRQYDLGLAWVHFPEGYGGLGMAASLQSAISSRLLAAGAPDPATRNPIGYAMAAPTIVAHGARAQQQRYLRSLFTGEEIWSQLFSEPGAGSDVAGLATRAERDGGAWVVNGQKVWTTLAHRARWGIILVRTNPDVPKHRGLTAFVLDMHAPGVLVRPLRQMTGEAEFNEVFLTDVRIPDTERLGDVGDGWRVAITTLMNERVAIGGLAERKLDIMGIERAVDLWKARGGGNAVMRDTLMRLWVEAEVARLTTIRASKMRTAGTPGPEGSVGKLILSRLSQRITDFTVNLLGLDGLLMPAGYPSGESADTTAPASDQRAFLRARANSIEGGTTEIAKNIVAERVLGLPGDVRVDKDRPWRDLPR